MSCRNGCFNKGRTYGGWTGLMLAAYGGHARCMQSILATSNALVKNGNGQTALTIAADGGDVECVRLLLPFSKIEAKDRAGDTAYETARKLGHLDVCEVIDSYKRSQEEQAALESMITPAQNKNKTGGRL